MTVTTPGTTPDEQIEAFSEGLFEQALGAMELTIAHLGVELGLYEALRGETLTVTELAARADIDDRYAREWVEHQAVAGIVEVDDPAADATRRRYSLPEPHAVALLDQEHPAYLGSLTQLPLVFSRTLAELTEAFRTGAGIAYADFGLHGAQAGMTRPMFATSLAAEWVAALPDVHGRLEAGEALRIADFGTGEGWAAIYLAEAYPNCTVDGFDLDDASIAAARKHAADRGVTERVRFELRDVTDAASFEGDYDLVMCCEVIHDLADPVGALTAMRAAAGADGAVLVIDEKAHEHFDPSGDPIERLLYGFSILHCLPVGRVDDPSAETGTVMRPDTFEGYATAAGFTRVEDLGIEHEMFRFYRPRG